MGELTFTKNKIKDSYVVYFITNRSHYIGKICVFKDTPKDKLYLELESGDYYIEELEAIIDKMRGVSP